MDRRRARLPGPEAQERPVYNSLFQSLVEAGVAVFAPNVRGSSGFGRRFLHADDLDGRFGATDDVIACFEYLTATGLAEPDRIGCMGRSYGGYLTLAALVARPELFAVGVDVCGIANFETFYERTEPWITAAAISEYGDPQRDRELDWVTRHLAVDQGQTEGSPDRHPATRRNFDDGVRASHRGRAARTAVGTRRPGGRDRGGRR